MEFKVEPRPEGYAVVVLVHLVPTDEILFSTIQEATTAMGKLNTSAAIVKAVQSLTVAADSASDLEAEYFDVGAPSDEDVAPLGLTAADIAACVTLLQQIIALMGGQATTPATYRATLNKVRRIP